MIPHNRPTLNIEEEEAAIRVLRSGWLTQGKEVEAFENEFCKFIGLPGGHAVAVSSGTASLFLSIVSVRLIIYLTDPKVAARIDTTMGMITRSLFFCRSIFF